MKKLLRTFAILFLVTTVFTACSKDDDPADNDLFVGTYDGRISYNKEGSSVSERDGSVTVVKVGNNYNFQFSDGIPDLNGVEFQKDENSAFTVGDETKLITITASKLTIAFNKDGETWTADCDR